MYAQREHLDTHLHTMYISEVHTRMFASGTHVCAPCADQYTSVSDTNTSAPVKNTSVCTSSEFAPRRMSRAALDECSQNEHFARCALDASQTHSARFKSTPRIPHESLKLCHRNGTSMDAHKMHAETALKTDRRHRTDITPTLPGRATGRTTSQPTARLDEKRSHVDFRPLEQCAETPILRHSFPQGCPQGGARLSTGFTSACTPPSDRTPVRVCDPNSRSIMKPINSPTSRSPLRRAHITHLGSTPHSLSSMPRCAVRRSEGLMTRARHRGTGHLLRPGARPGRCADEVTQPCTPALRIHPELDTHLPRTCSAPR